MSEIKDTVGIFGNYDGQWTAAKVSSTGKLEVDISGGIGTGLATEALQNTSIGILNSVDTTSTESKLVLDEIESTSILTKDILDTQYQMLDSKINKGVDATLTEAQQVLTYGRNTNSNNCKAIEVDNAGNLKTTLQSVSGTVTMKTNDATLNAKVSKGEDTSIVSGAGGLQQILCYGMDNQGNLEPMNIDNSGHLKITINDVDETAIGLKMAGETTGGNQVNLRTETNGSLNVAVTSGQITGFATSALQTTGNISLGNIDTTLSDGIQIKGKFGAGTVDLQANSNSQLFVDVVSSSGNGGEDLYSNATVTANTASSNITIQKDRKIAIMGSTTSSTAQIGLAFVDHNADFWPSPEYADLYYDGTKYTFYMTVTNILTENVKVYFQTDANNVNLNYFTY